MTDCIPCLDLLEKGNSFPLLSYLDESGEDKQDIFDQSSIFGKEINLSQNNINQEYLKKVREKFGLNEIDEDVIFNYVYGILHSTDYRKKFKNNITKSLARIPIVNDVEDFFAF